MTDYSDELTRLIDERVALQMSRSSVVSYGTLVAGTPYDVNDPAAARIILDGSTVAVPCRLSSAVRNHSSLNVLGGTRVAVLRVGNQLLAVCEIGPAGYDGSTVVHAYTQDLASGNPPLPRNGQQALADDGSFGGIYHYADAYAGWKLTGGPVIDLTTQYTTSQLVTGNSSVANSGGSGTSNWSVNSLALYRQGSWVFGTLELDITSNTGSITVTGHNLTPDMTVASFVGGPDVIPLTRSYFSWSNHVDHGTGWVDTNGDVTLATSSSALSASSVNLRIPIHHISRTV